MDNSELPPHVSFPTGPGEPCPACASAKTRVLYALTGIPVHSCVILKDAQSARDFGRGDLRLALCADCGFLFNDQFDPQRVDYREDYEETQGFSGTFRAFLTQTISTLIEDASPQGQTVLEIGCGRGDFLEQLCAAANARGIGVDPSRSAGRVDRSAGRGLEFLHAEYGSEHHSLDVHGIVCRHTLEHLGPVRALVESIFAHLHNKPDSWTFFEVPDAERILNEGAFWDVYFEHCSYFSKASLARLFAAAGFRIEKLDGVYAAQYLHLLARPDSGAASTHNPSSSGLALPDLAPIEAAADAFAQRCQKELGAWHAWLQASPPGRVALWGSGSKATGFLTTVGSWDRVRCVVDINTDKQGHYCAGSGHPIVAPEDLVGANIERLLIMNPIYVQEITEQLASLGLHPEIRALG